MKKNANPTILIVILVLLIASSSIINLGVFIDGADIYNFCFSLAYVLVWLLFLFYSFKARSKALLKFYIIFWILESAYLPLYTLVSATPLVILVYVGHLVFLMPLVGFSYSYSILENIINTPIIFSISIIPFLIVSLIMLALGLIAKRRFIV